MVNDYFIGSTLSAFAADKFTIEHIEENAIKLDKELMDKKYWDYKVWHPAVATMYFAHRYYTIAAKIAEREIGEEEAKSLRYVANRFDLRKQKLHTIRCFWKARQAADAIGCTYDVYIRAAIRNFRANIKLMASHKANKNQRLPHPNQLATTFVWDEAFKDWASEKRKRFPMPESNQIKGNPDLWFRPEMEAWLVEEANRTQNPEHWIKKAREAGVIMGTTASQDMMT